MNQIFIILILSNMVTIGHLTITCIECWTFHSTECYPEKEIECNGSKCMTQSEYSIISNVHLNAVKKTCAIENMCGKCVSVSTNHNFNLRVSSECDYGNFSNDDLNYEKMCDDPLPLNNLQCPSCYLNTTTDGCKSTEMVFCGGNENKCADYRGLVEMANASKAPIQVPMSVKGCATSDVCTTGAATFPQAKEIKMVMLNCTDAMPVPSAGDNQ